MYEKVNKNHPDKVADRIAGAIVDLAYSKKPNPKVAVEVLIGHGKAFIINETDTSINTEDVKKIVYRIAKTENITVEYREVAQDPELAKNQAKDIRCGDNGIFKGLPTTAEQDSLAYITNEFDYEYDSDGKYIIDEKDRTLIVCQSNAKTVDLLKFIGENSFKHIVINPLGDWTGGINVDSGATNRKLGSDMGDAVTGGGLHGKDLSKADVSVNIYCHLLAEKLYKEVTAKCAIGDSAVEIYVDGKEYGKLPFVDIVKEARKYIKKIGGFEKLAEHGLIRA